MTVVVSRNPAISSQASNHTQPCGAFRAVIQVLISLGDPPIGGKSVVPGLLDPTLQRVDEQAAAIHQRWAEGGLFFGKPQQVCGDAHLAVAAVTCPDADHRDGQGLLHPARQI